MRNQELLYLSLEAGHLLGALSSKNLPLESLKTVENLSSWFQAVFSHKIFRVALNSLCKYVRSQLQGHFLRKTYSMKFIFLGPILFFNLISRVSRTEVFQFNIVQHQYGSSGPLISECRSEIRIANRGRRNRTKNR